MSESGGGSGRWTQWEERSDEVNLDFDSCWSYSIRGKERIGWADYRLRSNRVKQNRVVQQGVENRKTRQDKTSSTGN